MSEQEDNKPAIIRAILTLKDRQYITPHYIRITLTGDAVPEFSETTVGVNNKIFIPPAGVNDIHFPQFNAETGEWEAPAENLRPLVRTYTHSGIDVDKKEMYIDFVAHGDGGPASAWAIHAAPGAPLGVAMKRRTGPLYPAADYYLLIADATGIPVISAILRTLPAHAKGVAYIEVQGKEDEQVLATASDVEIRWIHNPAPGENLMLAEAVLSSEIPDKDKIACFGYIAAEFNTVKAVRRVLRLEKDWSKEELYAYAYWKYGVSEDGSVSDRQQEQKETT